jgi:hypothetical protein
MPQEDSQLEVVLAAQKSLRRSAPQSPLDARVLEAAAALSSAPGAAPDAVEAALEVLAFSALPRANRADVASALEAAAAASEEPSVIVAPTEAARASLLMLFLRLAPGDYFGLSAADLLELQPPRSRRLDGAVDCIVGLLRARPPTHQAADAADLQAACARLLWGLTQPDSLYGAP